MGYYHTTHNDPLISLLIEKELHSRQRLSRLLREIAPEFTGIAEAATDDEAIAKVERFSPNLIFVSTPVSPRLCHELIHGYAVNTPKVVLCKDFDERRMTSDELSSYFLIKPVDAQSLRDLLDSLESTTNGKGNDFPFEVDTDFEQDFYCGGNGSNGSTAHVHRLVVRRQGRFRFLSVDKVIWFGTEFRLVYAYTERRRYPIDIGLDQLEQRLDPNYFVRIHRSAIVNVRRVKQIVPTTGGRSKVLLDDPQERMLPLSASRAKPIKEILQR